mmetsp:Transcript_24516/g.27180  ORF Transcript_24516/g.27180 Transcript_24516/m.27180 type:complete len:87 (+) Transcript_24516:13-273(+)
MIPSVMKKDDIKYFQSSFWHLFHSTAAYYPEVPTEDDIKNNKEMLETFAETTSKSQDFEDFGSTFLKYMTDSPPVLDSRESFSVWM